MVTTPWTMDSLIRWNSLTKGSMNQGTFQPEIRNIEKFKLNLLSNETPVCHISYVPKELQVYCKFFIFHAKMFSSYLEEHNIMIQSRGEDNEWTPLIFSRKSFSICCTLSTTWCGMFPMTPLHVYSPQRQKPSPVFYLISQFMASKIVQRVVECCPCTWQSLFNPRHWVWSSNSCQKWFLLFLISLFKTMITRSDSWI